jgi:hypothetical protein
LQLAGYGVGVVALLLQLVDPVLQGPLLLLESRFLLAKLVDLGVDEAGGLGGELGPPQPAGELLLLGTEGREVLVNRLPCFLQSQQSFLVVLQLVVDQGRDDVLPGSELGNLLDDASLQDVGPDVVLLAAPVVIAYAINEPHPWAGPRFRMTL